MKPPTPFEDLLTGLTDEELAMLLQITLRRMKAAQGESEELALMLAADVPVIKAEIYKRKVTHEQRD